MPIYEYRCTACGHRYEILVSHADPGAPPCPRCGGARGERLPSAFAVVRTAEPPAPGPCGSANCVCRSS